MTLEQSGRVIVYTNQVPFDTDVLRTNVYKMTETSAISATVLGVGVNYQTMVRGFPCVPVSPPGLSVVVGSNQTPDVIYSLQPLDATPYGSLPADTVSSNFQYKQGFNFSPVTLSTPAPVTSGNSVIHLVEVAFSTQDVNNVSRPYFNSVDPGMPIFNNNFDTRTDLALVQVKVGIEAPFPTPPTPDPGFIGLYYVSVTFSQTSIVSGNISKVSSVEGQPFITEGLTQKASSSNVVTPAQLIGNTFTFWQDTGTANNIILNPSPSYGPLTSGMSIWFATPNTSTSGTVNATVNGQTFPIEIAPTIPLVPGDITSGSIYQMIFGGVAWILLNPSYTGASNFVSPVQLIDNSYTYWSDTGSVNNIILTPSPSYGTLSPGMSIKFSTTHTSTSAAVNATVNGQTFPVEIAPSVALIIGDIVNGGQYEMQFGGSSWNLLNPSLSGTSGSAVSPTQLQNQTFTYLSGLNTPNAYSATVSPGYSPVVAGASVTLEFSSGNTGNATLNVNTDGPQEIITAVPYYGLYKASAGEISGGTTHNFIKYASPNSWFMTDSNNPKCVYGEVTLVSSQSVPASTNVQVDFDTRVPLNDPYGLFLAAPDQAVVVIPGRYRVTLNINSSGSGTIPMFNLVKNATTISTLIEAFDYNTASLSLNCNASDVLLINCVTTIASPLTITSGIFQVEYLGPSDAVSA